jgi:hypothetical protein
MAEMPRTPEDRAWARAQDAPHPGSSIPTPGGTYVPEDRQPPGGTSPRPSVDPNRNARIFEAASQAMRDTQRFVVHGSTGPAIRPYQPYTPTRPSGPVFMPTWHPPIVWPHTPPPQGFHFWPTYTPRGPQLRPRDPRKGLPPPPAKSDRQGFYVLPLPPKVDSDGFFDIPLPAGASFGGVRAAGRSGGHIRFATPGVQDWDDATITFTFGNTVWLGGTGKPDPRERGLDHPRLESFDQVLEKSPQLREAMERAATVVGIDPGLLAACALHEDTSGGFYLKAGSPSWIIGVDNWDGRLPDVKRRVPQAERIVSRRVTKAEEAEWGIAPKNELGQKYGRHHFFAQGSDAILAVAVTLKYEEARLIDHAGGADAWRSIPVGERFAMLRWAYNAGPADPWAKVGKAAAGQSILLRSGPLYLRDRNGNIKLNDYGKPSHNAQRHATQAAGQAIHISQTFFNTKFPATDRMTW